MKSQLSASSKPPLKAAPCTATTVDPQRLDRAIRRIDFRDERAKPIDVLTGPFASVAAETEVRSLRLEDQNADVGLAGLMNRLPQRFRESKVDAVEWTLRNGGSMRPLS
jgi:hypothetical protein